MVINNKIMTSTSHPLRVDFIESEEYPILKKVGMTFAPGKIQRSALSGIWERNLTEDLTRLKTYYQTDVLVSLIEKHELEMLQISTLEADTNRAGIEFFYYPIKDVSVPKSLADFSEFIAKILAELKQNKTIVIHCKGGLGRTGLVAACLIIAVSNNRIDAEKAIKMVRALRSGTVEVPEQEQFVSSFADYWQLLEIEST